MISRRLSSGCLRQKPNFFAGKSKPLRQRFPVNSVDCVPDDKLPPRFPAFASPSSFSLTFFPGCRPFRFYATDEAELGPTIKMWPTEKEVAEFEEKTTKQNENVSLPPSEALQLTTKQYENFLELQRKFNRTDINSPPKQAPHLLSWLKNKISSWDIELRTDLRLGVHPDQTSWTSHFLGKDNLANNAAVAEAYEFIRQPRQNSDRYGMAATACGSGGGKTHFLEYIARNYNSQPGLEKVALLFVSFNSFTPLSAGGEEGKTAFISRLVYYYFAHPNASWNDFYERWQAEWSVMRQINLEVLASALLLSQKELMSDRGTEEKKKEKEELPVFLLLVDETVKAGAPVIFDCIRTLTDCWKRPGQNTESRPNFRVIASTLDTTLPSYGPASASDRPLVWLKLSALDKALTKAKSWKLLQDKYPSLAPPSNNQSNSAIASQVKREQDKFDYLLELTNYHPRWVEKLVGLYNPNRSLDHNFKAVSADLSESVSLTELRPYILQLIGPALLNKPVSTVSLEFRHLVACGLLVNKQLGGIWTAVPEFSLLLLSAWSELLLRQAPHDWDLQEDLLRPAVKQLQLLLAEGLSLDGHTFERFHARWEFLRLVFLAQPPQPEYLPTQPQLQPQQLQQVQPPPTWLTYRLRQERGLYPGQLFGANITIGPMNPDQFRLLSAADLGPNWHTPPPGSVVLAPTNNPGFDLVVQLANLRLLIETRYSDFLAPTTQGSAELKAKLRLVTDNAKLFQLRSTPPGPTYLVFVLRRNTTNDLAEELKTFWQEEIEQNSELSGVILVKSKELLNNSYGPSLKGLASFLLTRDQRTTL